MPKLESKEELNNFANTALNKLGATGAFYLSEEDYHDLMSAVVNYAEEYKEMKTDDGRPGVYFRPTTNSGPFFWLRRSQSQYGKFSVVGIVLDVDNPEVKEAIGVIKNAIGFTNPIIEETPKPVEVHDPALAIIKSKEDEISRMETLRTEIEEQGHSPSVVAELKKSIKGLETALKKIKENYGKGA